MLSFSLLPPPPPMKQMIIGEVFTPLPLSEGQILILLGKEVESGFEKEIKTTYMLKIFYRAICC